MGKPKWREYEARSKISVKFSAKERLEKYVRLRYVFGIDRLLPVAFVIADGKFEIEKREIK